MKVVPDAGKAGPPRLLVVGINYSPEPTGSGPYTAGLAEMAVESGYQVQVLTGVPHYPSWEVPASYRWRFRTDERVAGVPVRRLRHFVPERQSALTRAAWEATFLGQALTSRLPWRPDLIVASTPSLSGAVYGAVLARRLRVPYGVVVQDVVGAGLQGGVLGGASRLAGRVAAVERWALASAAEVAVVSPRFLPAMTAYGIAPERIRVMPNWSRISRATVSRDEARARLGWSANEFVVAHTGNMGLKQDLHTVVDAGRLASGRPDLRFLLVGDGNQREAIAAYADGLPNVELVPPVDEATYPLVLAAADVLLVSERASTGDMSLPSKLTSYLAAGRPVLAAVAPDGACASELAKTGGAASVVPPGDAAALLREVLALRTDEAKRLRMGSRASAYALAELGRDAAARNVATFLRCLRRKSVVRPLVPGPRQEPSSATALPTPGPVGYPR